MNAFGRLGTIALVGCAQACGPPGGLQGEQLHQGVLLYGDPEWGFSEFPDRIAVNASFGVSAMSDHQPAAITSLEPNRIAPMSAPPPLGQAATNDGCCDGCCLTTWFQAHGPGITSIEARTKDAILDFVDVTTVVPAAVEVRACAGAYNVILSSTDALPLYECVSEDAGATTKLVIVRGASLAPTVCVRTLDDKGHVLDGLLPFEWTPSASDATLELHVSHDARCATIGGLTLGTATVTVASGDLHVEIPVEVTP